MSAKKLAFREDGTFKILYLSDFQEPHDAIDPRTTAGMEAVLEAEKPDLVFLCGDNCHGPEIHSADVLKDYLVRLMEPVVRRGIPWCHVFGNHDHDADIPALEQLDIYASIPGCMTETVPGIPGATNFVLPVYSADGERILTAVWGLDSGRYIEEIREGLREEAMIEGRSRVSSIWGIVRFEQLMWYWNKSKELEALAGGPVPGAMGFHVAAWEFDYMRSENTSLTVTGNTQEAYDLGGLNSGVFAALVQRGDVKCILSGHTHKNTCSAEYCGIQMCNVGSAGYSAYGRDELRGGRIVEMNALEPEKMTTRMAYFDDYLR